MPYLALGATVVPSPAGASVLTAGDGEAATATPLAAVFAPISRAPTAWVPALGVLDGWSPAGTVVTVEPIRISTWPAGSDGSATGLVPNSAAILAALADAPVA